MIDNEEFVPLYDANQSNDIYPYWKYEPALCILLKLLLFPCRYSDMTPIFDTKSYSYVHKKYDLHYHRLRSPWNQSLLNPQQLQLYANVIHGKGLPLESCFGFVGGTIRQ